MKKKIQLFLLLYISIFSYCYGQDDDAIKLKIEKIIDGKKAKVGVSIANKNGRELVSIKGKDRFPLQSVFKLYIAIVVFHEIDHGNLSIDQTVNIKPKDLLPDTYSPLKIKFPYGTKMTLHNLLEYTVSESDNIECDILLQLIEGPQVVEKFFIRHHLKDLSIKINEEMQQASWNAEFINWTLPKVTNDILWMYYNKKLNLLSENSYSALWRMMTETNTGAARIKALLPKNTIVSH
ncbi:serine hydrolase [Flavobacterium psychroterrae]|uniref:beta-lactamase n=1 Tax=Flavobacterium psychroterrae TaxID=2133767 RepID=A0ABS5PKW1_9FLAO|nr:serine hydrolase [Flavobacterium psychroterrae]MBS7234096.1 serine hydrolase [Flavobacterium psychroterrae]